MKKRWQDLLKPQINNVTLAIILFLLASLPVFERESEGLFNIVVKTKTYSRGIPLTYEVSTSRELFLFLPGEIEREFIWLNLIINLIFWYALSSFVIHFYYTKKK
jgi:hypothetical protein